MMSIDSNEADHWLQLAKEFDAQFQKLSSLLSSSNGIVDSESDDEADKAVAGQVLGSMGETCQMLNAQLDAIFEGQAGLPSAQQLLQGLKRMIGLERASPSPMSTPTNCPPGKKQAVTPTRNSGVDFDAFPSTPTLDMLGLSGQTMALVGDPLMAYDSSDSEQQMILSSRRSFISSSTSMAAMSSPLRSMTGHLDQASRPSWTHLSTPPTGRANRQQHATPNSSSPFPYQSPLARE